MSTVDRPINRRRRKANAGYSSFNQGYALSAGSLLIDLSADDVLEPAAVEKLVERFSNLMDWMRIIFKMGTLGFLP